MELGLDGKIALVAASSKGLGRAIAEALASEGARVMVSGRNEDSLENTARDIVHRTGAEVDYCAADITLASGVEKLCAHTAERFGGVDVLIGNSGGPPAGAFDDFSDGDWQKAFELNLLSVVRLIRGTIPLMRGGGQGGRIVNIASSSIKQPIEGLVLSNAFRAAVAGLSKTLAAELGPDGILINTVGPGRISTERSEEIDRATAQRSGVTAEEVREQVEASIPIGRYGEPGEFARLVVFLASPANTYVTGQSLLIDGGMVRAF